MPFRSGKSKSILRENIAEGMRSYKHKGSFGNSGPISKEDAMRRVVAAAYAKQRESKR